MRIHGKVYHRFGPLQPDQGQQSKYAQLYILDAKEALAQRMKVAYNSKCSEDLMKKLSELIQRINPYASTFKQMYEKLKEQEKEATDKGIEYNPDSLKMYIAHKVNKIL